MTTSAAKLEAEEEKETARVEAFSDGIFAFAVTLLVLELKVPHGAEGGNQLASALAAQWPSYMGYVTSFLTIGIMWINHHRMFTLIRKVDDGLLLVNTLFLLGITVVPFPTAVLAEYFDTAACRVSAALYSGAYVVMAVLFNLLWRYASKDGRLLGRHADPERTAAITKAYSFGPAMYVVSFAAAFWNAGVSVGLTLAYAAFWALPSQNPFVKSRI